MNNEPSFPARRTRRRILLVTCLAVGTAASVGLLVASQWSPLLSVAAVVIALVAGFLAVWAALAEFAQWRAAARAEAERVNADHREHLQKLHSTQRQVLSAMDARTGALRTQLGETREKLSATRADLGRSQQEASRLRGDIEAVRLSNRNLRRENADLRVRVDTAETALASATASADEADVLTLPRRRAGGAAEFDLVDAPTVVDLDLQRLATPFVEELRTRHAN